MKWSVGGQDLLVEPLAPLLFRAPTDNDRGGSGGTSYLDRYLMLTCYIDLAVTLHAAHCTSVSAPLRAPGTLNGHHNMR